jgi:hypothetical protein
LAIHKQAPLRKSTHFILGKFNQIRDERYFHTPDGARFRHS